MRGCHHEPERDRKGKGGTKAGKRKKREREGTDDGKLEPTNSRIWPFRRTRFPFLTPYSRNVLNNNKAALGGPSPCPCPVIPSVPTPKRLMMRPNGTEKSPISLSLRPHPRPRPSDAEIWWSLAEPGPRPGLASLPAFPFSLITSRALIFSLYPPSLDCLASRIPPIPIPSFLCTV